MRFKKMAEPDWSVWRHVARLTPEEAVSLTMNFCPHVIKRILAEVSESGSMDLSSMFSLIASGEGMSTQDVQKFEQRLLILKRNSGGYIEATELPNVAERCEWDVPTELAPVTSPLSESERSKLLKQIGGLSLLLAEKSNLYKRGDNPNADQIAKGVMDAIEGLPARKGLGNSSLRASIKEGINLLKS